MHNIHQTRTTHKPTQTHMNPLDWETFFRERASSRDTVSFVPLWARQMSSVPQLLLDERTRRATVDTLFSVGSVLSQYVPYGSTTVLVYRVALAGGNSLAILRIENPRALQSDDDDARVQVTLMTLQGEPEPALEELYTSQGDGQATKDTVERDFALTMTRTILFNAFPGRPEMRQYTDEELADRLQETADRQIERTLRPSAAVAHIVRQLASSGTSNVPLLETVGEIITQYQRDAPQIVTTLAARLKDGDDFYQATRIVTDFYNIPINVVERYLEPADWPSQLLIDDGAGELTFGDIRLAKAATVIGVLLDIKAALTVLGDTGVVDRGVLERLAFLVTDSDTDDAEASANGLVVSTSEGVALVQYGTLVNGEKVVRRTTLTPSGGALMQSAPRGAPVVPVAGTRPVSRLITTAGGRSIPAQQYGVVELMREGVDQKAVMHGYALFRFIRSLMVQSEKEAEERTMLQTFALLAIARGIAHDPTQRALLRVYEALPENIQVRVRHVLMFVYNTDPLSTSRTAAATTPEDEASMSRSVAHHTTNSAVRPEPESSETWSGLLVRALFQLLPQEQHAALRLVAPAFDRELRAQQPAIYAAAFEEAYPALADLFDHTLPPWAQSSEEPKEGEAPKPQTQSDAAARLERVLNDSLRARIVAASAAKDELARLQKIAADDQQLRRQQALVAETETYLEQTQDLVNKLSRRNLLASYSTLTPNEVERSNENRAWQLLFRTINAITTHPEVLTHVRIMQEAILGGDVNNNIRIVDAADIVYQPMYTYTNRDALPLRNERLQRELQRDVRRGTYYLRAHNPLLFGRYYVWKQPLNTPTQYDPNIRSSASQSLVEYERNRNLEELVYMRMLSSFLAIDKQTGLIADADNARTTFRPFIDWPGNFMVQHRPDADVVQRVERVDTYTWGQTVGGVFVHRVVSAVVYEEPVLPSVPSVRDTSLYVNPAQISLVRRFERRLMLAAVDVSLMSELRMYASKIPALRTVSLAQTPELYEAVRQSLDANDIPGFAGDPNGFAVASADYMVQIAPTLVAFRLPPYLDVLKRSATMRARLIDDIRRTFEATFGTLARWIGAGARGQFTELDYRVLEVLYTLAAFQLPLLASRRSFPHMSWRTLLKEMPVELQRDFAALVNTARQLAGSVRATGFNIIRTSPEKRAEFVAQMEALGLAYPNMFGDEGPRRSRRLAANNDDDDNDNEPIIKRRK